MISDVYMMRQGTKAHETVDNRIIEEEESASNMSMSDRIHPINIPQIVLDRSQTRKDDKVEQPVINRQLKPQDIEGYMEE